MFAQVGNPTFLTVSQSRGYDYFLYSLQALDEHMPTQRHPTPVVTVTPSLFARSLLHLYDSFMKYIDQDAFERTAIDSVSSFERTIHLYDLIPKFILSSQ